MNDDQNTNLDTQTDTGGGETVKEVSASEATSTETAKEQQLTIDKINEMTGKQFKDVDAFLKSYKEAEKYVGTQKDQKLSEAMKQLEEKGFVSKEQYETDMFFSKNTNYERDRKIIESLSKSEGKTVKEVVELDAYKEIAKERDGYAKSKDAENVLKTNPRIASSRTTMEKANQLAKEGNTKAAGELGVKAIMEALGDV
jgi:DNA-binding HxlR family transcriptional regulator